MLFTLLTMMAIVGSGTLLAAGVLPPTHPALAEEGRSEHHRVAPSDIASLEQLLTHIRHQLDARILRVELEYDDSAPAWVYEAKVLTPNGYVLKLVYDAHDLSLRRSKGHYPVPAEGDD